VSAAAGLFAVGAAAQPVTHTAALPLPPGGWPDLTPDQLQALDAEGRCVITDHGAFVLVNVYGEAGVVLFSVYGPSQGQAGTVDKQGASGCVFACDSSATWFECSCLQQAMPTAQLVQQASSVTGASQGPTCWLCVPMVSVAPPVQVLP
jgi:hypothetical protein